MSKKEVKKPEKKVEKKAAEPKYTDILEEFFFEDGQEMVKRVFMNGDKKVKEEITKNN